MAGEAKTESFMLGTATVMIGPQADVFDLTPEKHSVGLVKNFRITGEPQYTDLTQGVRNQLVFSVMTQNTVRASMEVYEYTSQNLAYALGQEGSGLKPQDVETTVGTAAEEGAQSLALESADGFEEDSFIMIYPLGDQENIVIRKVKSVTDNSIELTEKLGQQVTEGSIVRKTNVLSIGAKENQPFLSAKAVGQLADGPDVVLLCPKIRITNGFSVGFTTENFDNMPYEFSFFDLVTNDSHYRHFGGAQAQLLTQK